MRIGKRIYIILAVMVLLGVPALTPAVAEPLEPLSPDRFVFDTADVPEEVRPAIMAAVNRRDAALWPRAEGIAVGVYRQAEGWGLGSVAAAVDGHPPEWGDARWLVARRESGGWLVALEGSEAYYALAAQAPAELRIPGPSQPAVGAHDAGDAVGFRFPWDHLEQWYYTSAWHSGTAQDFANPRGTPGVVLAAADGVVRVVCDDGQQASLRLENGVLGDTTYVHLRADSVPLGVLDRPVYQGRELGQVYDGAAGSGWYMIGTWPWLPCDPSASPPCNWSTRSGCCYLRYNTTCGAGTGPHVHWVLPSRSVTVDGWESREDGCWQNASEVRCVGAQFASTNVRHTNDVTDPPASPVLTTPEADLWSAARTITLAWDPGAGSPPEEYEVEVRGEGWQMVLPWSDEATTTIVLPGDGRYTWRVRARREDLVGPWSAERAFHVAAAAPPAPQIEVSGEGCEGVANNAWQGTCRAPEFTWQVTGASAEVAGYLYSWSDASDGSPMEWTTVPRLAPGEIAPADGAASMYLNVVARDVLGNESSRATFALRYDGTWQDVPSAPGTGSPALPGGQEGFGLRIDGGAAYTNASAVEVAVWGPGVTEMALSVDGTIPKAGWQRLGPADVALPQDGDALAARRVYAWFRDDEGRVFGPYHDEIIHDAVAPTAALVIGADGPVLRAWDDNSGVSHMRLGSQRDLSEATWVPYQPGVPDQLAGRLFYAQVRDRAGNASLIYGSDGSVHDPEAATLVTHLPLVMHLLKDAN